MIKKILFVSLSNIGDAVMTLPTLIYLKKKHPSAKFDLICDARSVEIFQFFPSINKIYIRDKKGDISYQFRFIRKIRQTNYDLAVDLKTDFLLWFLRAKRKIRKVNDKSLHSVEKHFISICSNLKKIPDPKIYIPTKLQNNIKKIFPSNKGKTIALALGANSNHKVWPTENYVRLLELLKIQFKNIILIGSKNEMDKAQLFKKLYTKKVYDFCGKLTLLETASIIKKSDFFIGNDSGLGHIASAVNTQSFIIFGDGDPDRYHPWGNKSSWYQNTEKDISLITPKKIYKEIINILD
jgi:ADP-heptose:LPS heptosyltransferase